MSRDIVERLRETVEAGRTGIIHMGDLLEAANEIGKLRTAARLALTRLGELNRDDEAGIRMVLANALPSGER